MSEFRFFVYNKQQNAEDSMRGKQYHSFPSYEKAEQWIRNSAWRPSQMEIRFEESWKTAAEVSILNNPDA